MGFEIFINADKINIFENILYRVEVFRGDPRKIKAVSIVDAKQKKNG